MNPAKWDEMRESIPTLEEKTLKLRICSALLRKKRENREKKERKEKTDYSHVLMQ